MLVNLETIGASIVQGMVVINSQGIICYFNKAAGQIFGISPEQVIGHKITDFFKHSERFLEVLETGEDQLNRKVEINGKVLLSSRTPILEDGRIVGAVSVFQRLEDVEAIHRELRVVQELNSELEGILESSYDGIGVVDSQGRLVRLNASHERITGLSKGELLNRDLDGLVKVGVFSVAPSLITLREKKRVTMTQEVKTGAKVLITSNPIFNSEGEIIRVIANIRDMTELDKLREESLKHQILSQQYHSEMEALRAQQLLPEDIVARSTKMRWVVDMAVRVAMTDTSVLIEGESGVGKEVVAKLIHRTSSRRNGPYIKINCAAIPQSLLESELFGYSPGAFTGAQKNGKLGLFELAQNGTILLDEIGELPLELQAKLLRVLEEQSLYRLGSTKPVKLNVRLLAATNRDLQEMVSLKTFRQDLYYRIKVFPIVVPPLRLRQEDIPPLINLYLTRLNDRFKTNKKLNSVALSLLENYQWPGNVRQLQNLLETLVIVSEKEVIDEREVLNLLGSNSMENDTNTPIVVNRMIPLAKAQEILEMELLEKAMNNSKSARQVAKLLGISHPTAISKMAKYGKSIKNKNFNK